LFLLPYSFKKLELNAMNEAVVASIHDMKLLTHGESWEKMASNEQKQGTQCVKQSFW